jgi:ankyrin repeat protein
MGIDPNAGSESGLTPLMLSCAAGHSGFVSALTRIDGVEGDAVDIEGNTALHHAAAADALGPLSIIAPLSDLSGTNYQGNNFFESALVSCC